MQCFLVLWWGGIPSLSHMHHPFIFLRFIYFLGIKSCAYLQICIILLLRNVLHRPCFISPWLVLHSRGKPVVKWYLISFHFCVCIDSESTRDWLSLQSMVALVSDLSDFCGGVLLSCQPVSLFCKMFRYSFWDLNLYCCFY